MAKISRRAVASSSSNSATITSSSSSASSSFVQNSSASSSSSASLSSATGGTANIRTTSQQAVSSEGRTNANSILNEGKSTRSVSSSGATHFIDTPLGGYASASATVTATPYPLRNDGTQFTTTHSNVYAYTTTTG